MRYGFIKRKFPERLRPLKYPNSYPEPRWRHVVHITGGVTEDCWLSLGDEYLVIGGSPSQGGTLLVDPGVSAPLSLERAFQCCNLLSFMNDAAVLPQQWKKAPRRMRSANTPTYAKALDGIVPGSVHRYLEKLAEVVEVTGDLFVGAPWEYELEMPLEAYAHLPRHQDVWRAMTAYWSGLLSVTFPGRILNFWRAMEAVTSKQERYALFRTLPAARTSPMWLSRRYKATGRTRMDAEKPLRRLALKQHASLLAQHGSPDAALDVLYLDRRGRAAHADRAALEFDHFLDLGEQARDALLLQYMARVAIQRSWR